MEKEASKICHRLFQVAVFFHLQKEEMQKSKWNISYIVEEYDSRKILFSIKKFWIWFKIHPW